VLRGLLEREESSFCIGAKHTIKMRLGEVEDGLIDELDARIGDGDVKSTKPFEAGGEQAFDIGDFRDVCLDRDSRRARALDRGDRFFRARLVFGIIDDDARAQGAVPLSNRLADTARGAGDEGDLVLQTRH
jgi:hypothetical protein